MHAFMISYMYTHRIINTKFKIIFKMFVYSNLAFYHISTLKKFSNYVYVPNVYMHIHNYRNMHRFM